MQLKHYVAWRLSRVVVHGDSGAVLGGICGAGACSQTPPTPSEGGLTADPPPPDGSVPLEYSNGNLGELVIVSSTLAAEK